MPAPAWLAAAAPAAAEPWREPAAWPSSTLAEQGRSAGALAACPAAAASNCSSAADPDAGHAGSSARSGVLTRDIPLVLGLPTRGSPCAPDGLAESPLAPPVSRNACSAFVPPPCGPRTSVTGDTARV